MSVNPQELASAAAEHLGKALRGSDMAEELTEGRLAVDYGFDGEAGWIELEDGSVYAITVRKVTRHPTSARSAP